MARPSHDAATTGARRGTRRQRFGAVPVVRDRPADDVGEDGGRFGRELQLAFGDEVDGLIHVTTMGVSLRSGVCRLDVVPNPKSPSLMQPPEFAT